jgi:hypothetical protein
MASSSASALRMIGAPIDEPQHRRPKKIAAPNELSAPKWSNPSATPPLSNKPPSDRDVGAGFALFVPLGTIQCGSRLIPLPITRSSSG